MIDFTKDGLTPIIANSGLVPSDLVMVEYQVVYCTLETHTALDGFLKDQLHTIHAGEEVSDELDFYQTIDFVPA